MRRELLEKFDRLEGKMRIFICDVCGDQIGETGVSATVANGRIVSLQKVGSAKKESSYEKHYCGSICIQGQIEAIFGRQIPAPDKDDSP